MRFGRALTLLAAGLVEIMAAAASVVLLILSFGLGLVFLYPMQVRMVRQVAGWTRDTSARWSGVEIESPYLPRPAPPKMMSDGWYRSERTLYKSPRVPAWNARWKWMITDPATWRDLLWVFLDPIVKLGLSPLLLVLPVRTMQMHAHWSALLLSPTAASRLAGQVRHLNKVRTLAADTQAAEMRRIERDLHDGTQARLVALGMTIGAVEQLIDDNPSAAKALLAKARDASADTLTELRRVVRGIHPPVLAERGLGDAVRALAMDSAMRVRVEVDLPHRPESPVEAAVYFAVSELLSNAARHGKAASAVVDISHSHGDLRVTVTDDGEGGADPAKGSGLNGIERRLAAFDGVLAINSPPGGPTTVAMQLPNCLPQPWTGNLGKLPRWKAILVTFCWALAWLPLWPQGVVASIMKMIDVEDRSWFLALYLPEPLQWPFLILMVALGTSMYAAAVLLPATHPKDDSWMGLESKRC
ncbi:histidine kinase [Nonomuraea sp. NBC_01738]|uniref:sensor histidine kinase n=1 Tax=Nonomuraea sp. NBC_01738 TaxID=2976003 RepID=UPI002E109D4C|nr:histidine kinase [Nonomuraea sp. NBC_01738]